MNAIEGSVALVTGGSRGIGRALVAALYERGAKKVSATARDPRTVTHPDAVPLAPEVTDPASVAAAAERAQDADDPSRQVKAGLAADPAGLYPQLSAA